MRNESNQHIFEQLPGYIGWKDKNLYHSGCNRNLAVALGLKETSQIIGLKDCDLLDHTEESDLFHEKNDFLALQGNTVKGIHRSSAPYDGSLFYFVKKPLLDNFNQINGLIYYCHEFIPPSTFSHIFEINNKNCFEGFKPTHYRIIPQDNICNLSDRELECMFFILRGKSAKQIGEYIGLSKRTIESYIENIKNKLGCQNKAELILKALNMGYLNSIPSRFLQN